MNIILENDGNVNWPEECYLKNIHGIFGDKVRINDFVKPGSKCLVQITFGPKNLNAGEYNSRWQLYDGKDLAFGRFVDIKFKVTPKKEEAKREEVVRPKAYRFYNKLHEMKNAYYLVEVQNEKILDALEKANGNVEDAIVYLL